MPSSHLTFSIVVLLLSYTWWHWLKLAYLLSGLHQNLPRWGAATSKVHAAGTYRPPYKFWILLKSNIFADWYRGTQLQTEDVLVRKYIFNPRGRSSQNPGVKLRQARLTTNRQNPKSKKGSIMIRSQTLNTRELVHKGNKDNLGAGFKWQEDKHMKHKTKPHPHIVAFGVRVCRRKRHKDGPCYPHWYHGKGWL